MKINRDEIAKIIEEKRYEHNYFGLRACTRNPKTGEHKHLSVGDNPGYSYIWDDGTETDQMLDGVCALGISSDADDDMIDSVIEQVGIYDDRYQVILIGSDRSDYGEDEGELVMIDGTILAEWS